jgi:hypothetical protein
MSGARGARLRRAIPDMRENNDLDRLALAPAQIMLANWIVARRSIREAPPLKIGTLSASQVRLIPAPCVLRRNV